MSYVPKALSEVSRVLKYDGYFYCATYGENTILSNIAKLIEVDLKENDWIFTLQNGNDILKPYFKEVKRLDYVASLEITEIDDLIDYIESLKGMHEIFKMDKSTLKERLTSKMKNGILTIPKEYGMFVCKK